MKTGKPENEKSRPPVFSYSRFQLPFTYYALFFPFLLSKNRICAIMGGFTIRNERMPSMKITEIESIPLRVPYEERIRKQFHHFGTGRADDGL